MSGQLDAKEKVWVEYDGYLAKETEKAFGVGTRLKGRCEFFVPKSIAGKITYTEFGDLLEIREGQKIEAFRCQRWFAREQQLIGWNE